MRFAFTLRQQQDRLMKNQRQMGPLHDPVTWYKITYTGHSEQAAPWDLQNNAISTSSPGPAFVLETYFVPCDRAV